MVITLSDIMALEVNPQPRPKFLGGVYIRVENKEIISVDFNNLDLKLAMYSYKP